MKAIFVAFWPLIFIVGSFVLAVAIDLMKRKCKVCHGTGSEWFDREGHVYDMKCWRCEGSGRVLFP